MRLSCQQEQLHRGLSAVARAIPARTTLPITQHILFDASGDNVLLSATDAETIAITYSIPAEIDEPGSITMPSRLVSDFVATLPSETILLSLAGRAKQVSLSCARNTASIGGLDPEDFPPIPPVDNAASLTLDSDRLRKAINQTVFAAATDDSRPVLTGVNIEISSDEICFAAADGFRLSVHTMDIQQDVESRSVIIPARALGELSRLLTETSGDVVMTFNSSGTQVQFDLGHAKLVAQLIQGSFPNYNQLIPSDSATHTEFSVSELIRETRIASIFARDGSGIVRLVGSPGEGNAPGRLEITARADEVGDNEGEIDAIVEGEPTQIAFNGRYLLDALQVMDTDRAVIDTSSPSSPGIIRPVADESFVHVVLPLFVQW